MKTIGCIVLMVGLGLSGSLWAVETPECEMPSFKSLNGDGDDGRETKDEPAEDDIDFVEEGFGEAAWMPLYYEGSDGRIYLNLEKLSDELWMMILEFLDFGDLGRLAQVSPFFLRMIQDPDVLGPREIWPHYAGLSRFPSANDRSVLNQQLLDSFRDWAPRLSLSQEHCLYFLQRILRLGGTDNLGCRLLHRAAAYGFEQIMPILIELGAHVNAVDAYGLTPLHWAVIEQPLKIARVLLGLGADIHVKDFGGRTLLHWAIIKQHLEMVHALVELDVDLNVADNEGWTPLHLATTMQAVNFVETLVALGADVDVRNDEGETPLDLATRNENVEVLVALGVNPDTEGS